jgi:alanine racemase
MVHNGIRVINEKQLIANITEIKNIIGEDKKICAMVKADAYGHGIEKISKLLINKIDFLGVANINEAILIRNLNEKIKILIVGKTYSFEDCLNNNISFIIDSLNHFKMLLKFLDNDNIKNKCINIHLKINSGMNRLGINSIEEFKEIYKISKLKGINIEGVSTHFATADCDIINFKKQLEIFSKFLKEIPKDEEPIIHIGGSAVLSKANQELLKNNFNMVRTGIAIYGYNAEKTSKKIKPILKLETRIIKIIDLKQGDYLGYSKGFRASQDMKIGVIPLGYGDGISRNLANKICVEVITKEFSKKHINKCAVIGNICMDMFFIDITNLKFVKEGDKVIVVKNVKKWAEILQTIPYEIITNFGLLR